MEWGLLHRIPVLMIKFWWWLVSPKKFLVLINRHLTSLLLLSSSRISHLSWIGKCFCMVLIPFLCLWRMSRMIYVPCSLEQGTRVLMPRELISRKLNPGLYKGPIQYMMWREMQSSLSPGISGQ